MTNNHRLNYHEFPVRRLPKIDTSPTAIAEQLLAEQLSHKLIKPDIASKPRKFFDSAKEVTFRESPKKEKFPSDLVLTSVRVST